MTVLTMLAVLLVGQPDTPATGHATIPDLPWVLPPAAAPDVEPSPEAPSGDPTVDGPTSADNGVPSVKENHHALTDTRNPEGGGDRAPVGREGPEPPSIPEHWLELARCESGNWIDGGASFEGPIRWNWGAPDMQLPPWGTDIHEGGLQWLGSTWSWLAPIVLGDDAPGRAYDASPAQEIAVAEHYVALEQADGRGGWGPWPTCGPLVGLPT